MPSTLPCFRFTLTHYICSLTETMSWNFGKFHGSGENRFGSSKKDRYFLKIPKWQHKLVRNYKRWKLVSYFLNKAPKTWLCGLKISENFEIEHVFQSKAKHFFVSLAISTQVASMPLKKSSWQIFELIKALEIKTSMLFNLDFGNNTISSSFFLFFLTIDLYFLRLLHKFQ